MNRTLEFLVYPECAGDGETAYVAQCVQHAICVQGQSFKQIKNRILETLTQHVQIAESNGMVPFECLPEPLPEVIRRYEMINTEGGATRNSFPIAARPDSGSMPYEASLAYA